MWYAKMYFSGEKEFFENDAFGMQGVPSRQLELPFLESLLTFLELDEKEITPMLERISVNWEHFVESSDLGAHTAAMWSWVCWLRSTFTFAFYIRAATVAAPEETWAKRRFRQLLWI